MTASARPRNIAIRRSPLERIEYEKPLTVTQKSGKPYRLVFEVGGDVFPEYRLTAAGNRVEIIPAPAGR